MHRLENKQFGRLTVLWKSLRIDKSGHIYWECRCSCGRSTRYKPISCSVVIPKVVAALHKKCEENHESRTEKLVDLAATGVLEPNCSMRLRLGQRKKNCLLT